MTSLQLGDNKVEIWCGQSQGQVAIFCLTESVVTNQDHYVKQPRPMRPDEVVAVVDEEAAAVDPGVSVEAEGDPVGVEEGVVDHEAVDAVVAVNLLVLLYVQIH